MEDLACMIFEFFLEVFDKLYLYPLFPRKKRSKKRDGFLKFMGYVPTFVAFATILICAIISFGWSHQYATACFIAMVISGLYLLTVMILNFAIGQ